MEEINKEELKEEDSVEEILQVDKDIDSEKVVIIGEKRIRP